MEISCQSQIYWKSSLACWNTSWNVSTKTKVILKVSTMKMFISIVDGHDDSLIERSVNVILFVSDDLDDSNIITSQHQVISSLLKEEFGTSHQGDSKPEKSTQSTTKQTRCFLDRILSIT